MASISLRHRRPLHSPLPCCIEQYRLVREKPWVQIVGLCGRLTTHCLQVRIHIRIRVAHTFYRSQCYGIRAGSWTWAVVNKVPISSYVLIPSAAARTSVPSKPLFPHLVHLYHCSSVSPVQSSPAPGSHSPFTPAPQQRP